MKKVIDAIVLKVVRGFHLCEDIWLGLAVSLVSACMFYYSFSFKVIKTASSNLDTARFAPQLVFGGLFLCGIVLLIQGITAIPKRKASLPSVEKLMSSVNSFERIFVGLVGVGIFIFCMQYIGFIPCAILYMVLNMLYMSTKSGWKIPTYIIVAVLVTAILYVLFRFFMYVHLPDGLLEGVLN